MLKSKPTSDNDVFKKPNNWTMCMPIIFLWQTEVAGMMTMTLSCWVRALMRNLVFHLHLLSISSPAPNGIIGGIDYESTVMWVDLWWGCTNNCGDDHHGCSHLFLSWLRTWGSKAWHSASPCHHTWSTTRANTGSPGFSTRTIAGHRDGAYVPWATNGRASASINDPSYQWPSFSFS